LLREVSVGVVVIYELSWPVAADVDGDMTTADVWDMQIALQVSKRLDSPLLSLC
jgi:hypothetical protein